MIDRLRTHCVRVLGLFACYLGSLLIVDPRGEFPLNDDWVYARACIQSARAGHLKLTAFESAWSLPQIILGAIAAKSIGFSHAAFRAAGIGSLLISALLIDLYLRRVGLPSGGRLIAMGSWIFNPVAYLLSLSFMTDLPFIVLWIGACYCWDMALTTEKRRWFALALLATLVAAMQRQLGMLIPLAACLLVFARWRWRIGSRRMVVSFSLPTKIGGYELPSLIAAGAAVLIFLVVSTWRARIGGYQLPLITAIHPLSFYLVTLYRVALFFALSSIPLLPILARPKLSRASSRLAAGLALAVLLFGGAFLARGASPLFGNLLSEYGLFEETGSFVGSVLMGRREVIFGAGWNRAADLLGLLALLMMIRLLCGAPWARPRKVDRDSSKAESSGCPGGATDDGFGGVLTLAGALMVATFIVRGFYLDRYLLPVLPSVWVALARCGAAPGPRSRIRRAAAAGSIAALAAFSITIASDYFRWNEARWAAAEKLRRGGVPAGRIQAGYEWHGEYVADKSHPSTDPSEFDYVVSFSGGIDGFREVDAVPWKSIWPPGGRKIHVLKNERPRGPGTEVGEIINK